MKRGELYRVAKPSAREPKKFRVFVVVSRQLLIDSIHVFQPSFVRQFIRFMTVYRLKCLLEWMKA